jgi:hypothetical protein
MNLTGRAADTSDMPRVPLVDRLLLWLFGVARNLFFLQGLAFGLRVRGDLRVDAIGRVPVVDAIPRGRRR